jgi:hypothetical protein
MTRSQYAGISIGSKVTIRSKDKINSISKISRKVKMSRKPMAAARSIEMGIKRTQKGQKEKKQGNNVSKREGRD